MEEKLIKDAQYRKGASIAFFNATNAAIELVKTRGAMNMDDPATKEAIIFWRDWFIEQHKSYYAEVIANIGTNYSAEDAMDRLKSSKTLLELESSWRCLSADERQNPEILKVAQELKKAFNEKA